MPHVRPSTDCRIPGEWLKKSWEASTLGVWFSGLLLRYDQLFKWLNNGRPKAYWLTGFFNPQGFLTAVKQEVSHLPSLLGSCVVCIFDLSDGQLGSRKVELPG
jgi:hypothetical protein